MRLPAARRLPVSRRLPVALLLCTILLAPLFSSCDLVFGPPTKPINWYLADPSDVQPVRRVMLLPFQSESGVHAETENVRIAFRNELNKIQRFQVVPLPRGADEDEQVYTSVQRGRVSVEALVALAERYRLDGVMVGQVTSYRPYLPPNLGLRVRLFSVHSGSWIWAADGHYDASDRDTMQDLEHYHKSFLKKETSLHGVQMNLISPRRFAAYVCHRLVGTWREAKAQKR